MKPPFEEQNRPARGALRALGFVLTPIGGIFLLIGLADFFAAFGGRGFPTRFWCAFVGMPLLAAGVACLKAGYLGAIGRYVAGESAPAASASVNYIAEELRPTVRRYAEDLENVRAQAPGSAPAAGGDEDPVTRMRRLEDLRRAGLVSAAEYEAKRAEILKAI